MPGWLRLKWWIATGDVLDADDDPPLVMFPEAPAQPATGVALAAQVAAFGGEAE